MKVLAIEALATKALAAETLALTKVLALAKALTLKVKALIASLRAAVVVAYILVIIDIRIRTI